MYQFSTNYKGKYSWKLVLRSSAARAEWASKSLIKIKTNKTHQWYFGLI
jgi:hypothetical protein